MASLELRFQNFVVSGILSLAVALIHSYTFHEHETRVAAIAESLGFTNISLSSQIMPMVRLVPRGFTASVSFLAPRFQCHLFETSDCVCY